MLGLYYSNSLRLFPIQFFKYWLNGPRVHCRYRTNNYIKCTKVSLENETIKPFKRWSAQAHVSKNKTYNTKYIIITKNKYKRDRVQNIKKTEEITVVGIIFVKTFKEWKVMIFNKTSTFYEIGA